MPEQDNERKSSQFTTLRSLKFRVPEMEDVEVYLVRLEDGRVVARTREELEELEEEE